MIVLDTNVLSEAVKPAPNAAVMNWFARQAPLELFSTTVTLAEILYGVEALPAGKRRAALLAAAENMFTLEFVGRILPFDEDAARVFPKIVTGRAALGRPISQSDAMIAAIARSRRAPLATRNSKDFEHCGLRLIDPWAV